MDSAVHRDSAGITLTPGVDIDKGIELCKEPGHGYYNCNFEELPPWKLKTS
jgi:hypothetical protein